MNLDQKKQYLVELLVWIWLKKEKLSEVAWDIDKKSEEEINEIIIKLEWYYKKQNTLDKEFIRKLEKFNNKIDEVVESTFEKASLNNIKF